MRLTTLGTGTAAPSATRVNAGHLVDVAGVSLLDRAVAAVREIGAAPLVAVGPRAASDASVRWVREDPPFTGPVAAIVAALAAMPGAPDPAWTLVLACDLPRVGAAVRQLVDDILLLPSDVDGACLADPSSRPQWLTAAYRTAALRRAAASLADEGRDQSAGRR